MATGTDPAPRRSGDAAAWPGEHQPDEHHHRDIQGGSVRAAVFGVSDGLVSNLGIILGVAGADPAPAVVRVAGLAGLVAGAISMGAGEYNSVRVQNELFERELELERIELRRNPQGEQDELAEMYEARGLDEGHARELAEAMMSNPELALETHAKEELGMAPGSLGAPVGAAVSSLLAFSVGAVVPLAPWFFGSGGAATVASLVLAMVAAVVVGGAVASFTERSRARTVLRQLLFTFVPAGLTYAVGSALGVTVT
ncbi:VIT1/CCC1 transporter family protein [soil metagenome]